MINPLSYVKNVRTVYDRFYQKNIKEVQVQFLDENPAWIPYDTLLSMLQVDIKEDYTEWKDLSKYYLKLESLLGSLYPRQKIGYIHTEID